MLDLLPLDFQTDSTKFGRIKLKLNGKWNDCRGRFNHSTLLELLPDLVKNLMWWLCSKVICIWPVFYRWNTGKRRVYCPWRFSTNISESLWAVTLTARELVGTGGMHTSNLVIYSDSQTTLKALQLVSQSSALVNDCAKSSKTKLQVNLRLILCQLVTRVKQTMRDPTS